MDSPNLVDHLGLLFALAWREDWDEPIPGKETATLRLGILVQRIASVLPQFWNGDPEEVAAALLKLRPDLAAEITGCDLRALGFIMRIRRKLDERQSAAAGIR